MASQMLEAPSAKLKKRFEDWTVVVPRRSNHRNRRFYARSRAEGCGILHDSDPSVYIKLLNKMEFSIKKLEDSDFFSSFINQLRDGQIMSKLSLLLALHKKFQMVIYGIGSISSYEGPQLQLSLAILLKRQFDWVGEIEVFDPLVGAAESRVLEALGCKVLTVNEEGRRKALNPTLFFMPHCEAFLYNNLIETNWEPQLLNRVVILGNSFEQYAYGASLFMSYGITHTDKTHFILRSRKFIEEIAIDTASDDFFSAFHQTSWHFFCVDLALEWRSELLD